MDGWKARGVEGALNGLKLGLVHSLLFSPFVAKDMAVQAGKSIWPIYFKLFMRNKFLYSWVLFATYTSRHVVLSNKDRILFDLQYNFTFLRKSNIAQELILYWMFLAPLGFTMNYVITGNRIKGAFSFTLMFSLCTRLIDNGKGLQKPG